MTRQLENMDWLAGGGQMGALMRRHNWAQSQLGPLEHWPQSLRTSVSVILNSRFPMILFWGRQFTVLYNDAYIPIFGAKHPRVLGTSGFSAWGEVWDVIGPMLRHVVERGEATWSQDQLLVLSRHNYAEECYFTWSYSPIRQEDGTVGGVLTPIQETTTRVLGERRLRTLRELGAQTGESKTVDDACRTAVDTLSKNTACVHFAAIYLADGAHRLILGDAVRLRRDRLPTQIDLHATDVFSTALRQAISTSQLSSLSPLPVALTPTPDTHWPEPPVTAAAVPILSAEQQEAPGVLVMGISPRRALDDDYRGFIDLASAQIANSLAKAHAYAAERRRAEALAQLDRAKTAFFSNVSHEFRTPLSLMLGPIEDLLSEQRGSVNLEQRQELILLRRNAQRLLKLVNTLLDFSRIEAGRVRASFQPTDLASMTADLASAFRSTIERAGMSLIVNCTPMPEPVFVDRDMWEKIVLNLLSNAFKYTFAGEIAVTMQTTANMVHLAVRDTGVGVPEPELPRLFERFYRVQGVQGRSHEGTGIGLALVQELVRLHGGRVAIESQVGRGSCFSVYIPRGSAHLPPEHLRSHAELSPTSIDSEAFVEEAARWLPETTDDTAPPPVHLVERTTPVASTLHDLVRPLAHILLADDNADMRDYIRRLLVRSYRVTAVSDGQAALVAMQADTPDLIVTDVMMPRLDGFGLLAAVRADARWLTIPVLVLSARAGEEARIEGLRAGADEYLVKPFSARELLARISSLISMARVRAEAATRERALRAQAEAAIRYRDQFLGLASHELPTPLTSIKLQMEMTQRALSRFSLADELQARLSKMMRVHARQIANLENLTGDLLDVSRIVNGRLTFNPAPMDLGQLVREVVADLEESLADAKIDLDLICDDNVVGVWDRKRLEQVVVNLLSNATKYAAGSSVTISVRRHHEGAILVVNDTGPGIGKKNQENIFNLFERGSASRTTTSGLGLGLYIVKEIVVGHGGRVALTSENGQGTTFTVELPAPG